MLIHGAKVDLDRILNCRFNPFKYIILHINHIDRTRHQSVSAEVVNSKSLVRTVLENVRIASQNQYGHLEAVEIEVEADQTVVVAHGHETEACNTSFHSVSIEVKADSTECLLVEDHSLGYFSGN